MAKKKGGKKQKKGVGVKQDFVGMPPGQVADRGAQWLAAGNAREALKAFKFLKKSGYEPGIVSLGLFQSYLVRYGQLMEKNMIKEAHVVMAAALECFPTGGGVPLEILDKGIRFLPLEKAVDLYRVALASMDAVPEMERLIANRAVIEDNLDILDLLPGHLALVKEKEILKRAGDSMNAGHWGEAVNALTKIPRKSAFADIKIFAKLMAAFAEQDKPGVQRALSMLGKDFPLTSLQKLLAEYATGNDFPNLPGMDETASLLWGQAFHNEEHAGQFKKGVAENNLAKICRAVTGLAVSLDSPDKESAVEFLAKIAGLAILERGKELDQVLELFQKLSLQDPFFMLARFAAPINAFFNFYARDVWEQLDSIFPDQGEQDIAKGLILITIAKKMVDKFDLVFDSEDELNTLFEIAGVSLRICPEDIEVDQGENLLVLAVLEKVLALDLENQKAHELILGLSFDSPALRKALPPLLESMGSAFAQDPRPYVRLAQIYLQRSAVRKAESALKKAFSRAPHDGDVLEQYALCHVTAACKNLRLDKHELALKDLEAAEKMGVSSLVVYIREKRLVCDFAGELKFSRKMFEHITQGLTTVDTLRVLALFKLDLEDPDNKFPDSPRGLAAVFNSYKKKIKELPSKEIASLLIPVPTMCQELYYKKSYASLFLDKRAAVLNFLTDGDLMAVAVDLARYGYMEQVAGQLGKRVDMAKMDDDSISIRFLYLCLAWIQGGTVDPRFFMRIVDSVSTSSKERLRRISRQVATIAPKRLQPAFENFDFTQIDHPFFMDNLPFSPGSPDFEGFADIIEQIMDGKGGFDIKNAIESIIGRLNTISALDNEDDNYDSDDNSYDIDLSNFNAKKVFGNRVNPHEINELIYNIIDDALYMEDSRVAHDSRGDSIDLIESLDDLMVELRKSGFESSNDFRRAGKEFCLNIDYGREILLGFRTGNRYSGLSISKDLKSFILGMNQGC